MAQTSTLNDFLTAITDRSRMLIAQRRTRRVASQEIVELCEALLSNSGEASALARAEAALGGYRALDHAGKTSFFRVLAERFGPDETALKDAAAAYLADPSAAAAKLLQKRAEPRRIELFRRLNQTPGGTAQLVAMRVDLIERLSRHPDFWAVDDDLVQLFTAWFNRGFLLLRRIDWHTSASTLEKIIRYEAVHEIQDWEDLRRRIDVPDRRLYAFFHPRLGDDPLIFVEVALTDEMPAAIAPILAPDRQPLDAREATTAVFYSISNCQSGLKGISFGSFLIKQVAEDLGHELPQLKQFVTLSPVPRFAGWLAGEAARAAGPLAEPARAAVARLAEPDWRTDEDGSTRLARDVKPLAAWYLTRARDARGRLIDPVARFHLGNGARLERIDWAADLSERGLAEAHGLMVNYRYDLSEVEKNHEAFVSEGTVAMSSAVARLVRQVKPAEEKKGRAAEPKRNEGPARSEAQSIVVEVAATDSRVSAPIEDHASHGAGAMDKQPSPPPASSRTRGAARKPAV